MTDNFREKIYKNSPVVFQNILVSIQGSIFRRQRFDQEFYTELHSSQLRAKLPHKDVQIYQFETLKKFLIFAYENSPYYKSLFDQHQIIPKNFSALKDLKKIPILEKNTLRSQTEDIRTRCYDKDTLIPIYTSGTTGTPISAGFTKTDMQTRIAILYRMLGHFGIKPFDRSVRFSGRALYPRAEKNKIFWRKNWAGNQLLMSSYNLKIENFPYYVNKLKSYKPLMIDGYPSSIFILARYINNSGQSGQIKPKFIMTTAETLEPHQRDEISRAFGGCNIGNQYASSEGAPFITEDRFGDLVINEDTGIFEFVKPGTDIPAQAGEIGEMLVTSFTTHAYPLIRYRIGDTVLVEKETFAKSMNMRVVQQIMGRQEDILHTPFRGYVGRLDTVFKASPSTIIETQIVQTSPTSIQLNVVPDADRFVETDLDDIKSELIERLGDVTIEVSYHKALPRGKNGKLRAVIGLPS